MPRALVAPYPSGRTRRLRCFGLLLGLLLATPSGASPGAANQPAPVNLLTGMASNDLSAPFRRELTASKATTQWQVELHLRSAAERDTARRLGLFLGPAATQVVHLDAAQWAAVQATGLRFRLLGGVTRYHYEYGPYPTARPAAPAERASSVRPTPSAVLGTDSTLLSSGTINLVIPDQGSAWYQLQLGTEGAVPAGAIITLVNYSFRLNNPAQPADFSCQDYEVHLSSDAHGGAAPFHVVYDRWGGATDGGFDDDAEDDADVLIEGRKTDAFNGEDPNQAWYLVVFDTAAPHTGLLNYFELVLTWTAPDFDLAVAEVFFRDAPGNGGHRVDHPGVGQTLYAHLSYTVSAPVSGKIWTLELNGAELCTLSADVSAGPQVGGCDVPWQSTLGQHTLEARLDPGDTFLERDELNNTHQHTFQVSEDADIRLEPLVLEATAPTLTPLYLELDWMADGTHSHRPSAAVITRVQEAFAAAGYALHLDVDEEIPHQPVLAVSGSPSSSPAVQALISQYFDRAVDPRYFYSVWGHDYSYEGGATGSSGIADLPGRVHLVTLGSFANGVGSAEEQVGTLLHEFGHNLGQRHGGGDHSQYSPNYLSVMNYHYQLRPLGQALQALGFASNAVGFADFGYSHGLAPPLDENNLDETFGLGLGRAVDWNCNGSFETLVAQDVQAANWCQANGSRTLLADFDNWSNLAGHVPSLAAGTERPPEAPAPCITAAEHAPLARRFRELRALGVLPAEPPTPAAAGPTPLGAAARRFTVLNDGAADLVVTSLALDVATPWITWYPQTPWTLAPGGSQEVTVTIDFGRAPAGTTTRRLLVHSSDPDENPYPGGVAVTVTGRGHCTVATSATPASEGLTTGDITTSCGTPVTVKAFPQQGASFVRWTRDGAPVSTTSSYTFAATVATTTLAAEFANNSGDIALSRGVARSDLLRGTSVQGSWRYYYVDLPAGAGNLIVSLFNLPAGPPNDLDLYVRLGQKPTLSAYNCRSNRGGGGNEACGFGVPAAGRWWIGVNNWDVGDITYTIHADWTLPPGSTEEGKNPPPGPKP